MAATCTVLHIYISQVALKQVYPNIYNYLWIKFFLDNSSILGVVNSCYAACYERNIDYYRTKNKNELSDMDILNDMEINHGSDELENEVNNLIWVNYNYLIIVKLNITSWFHHNLLRI